MVRLRAVVIAVADRTTAGAGDEAASMAAKSGNSETPTGGADSGVAGAGFETAGNTGTASVGASADRAVAGEASAVGTIGGSDDTSAAGPVCAESSANTENSSEVTVGGLASSTGGAVGTIESGAGGETGMATGTDSAGLATGTAVAISALTGFAVAQSADPEIYFKFSVGFKAFFIANH